MKVENIEIQCTSVILLIFHFNIKSPLQSNNSQQTSTIQQITTTQFYLSLFIGFPIEIYMNFTRRTWRDVCNERISSQTCSASLSGSWASIFDHEVQRPPAEIVDHFPPDSRPRSGTTHPEHGPRCQRRPIRPAQGLRSWISRHENFHPAGLAFHLRPLIEHRSKRFPCFPRHARVRGVRLLNETEYLFFSSSFLNLAGIHESLKCDP